MTRRRSYPSQFITKLQLILEVIFLLDRISSFRTYLNGTNNKAFSISRTLRVLFSRSPLNTSSIVTRTWKVLSGSSTFTALEKLLEKSKPLSFRIRNLQKIKCLEATFWRGTKTRKRIQTQIFRLIAKMLHNKKFDIIKSQKRAKQNKTAQTLKYDSNFREFTLAASWSVFKKNSSKLRYLILSLLNSITRWIMFPSAK